ncbi:MAG: ABC transporter substrate-binding protein [Opitutaceae bacterium]|nr:ABC transporter substrate-binding protein [Opitutaceae bacterium]
MSTSCVPAAPAPVKVKLAPMPGFGGYLVPALAAKLGYFAQEGLDVELKDVMDFHPVDWRSTELLNSGEIDAEICWYHRTIYGIANKAPAKAVVLLEDSPGISIFVANKVKDQIKSAADFNGRRVAISDGFSTKHFLTDYIATRVGGAPDSFIQVPKEIQASVPSIVNGIKAGQVDVVTIMEPKTSQLVASNLVTLMYDLNNAEGTKKALGDVWPTRCLYVSPEFIKAHPDAVQRLVNAVVRTMRYINTHTAEEIFAQLPASYFDPHLGNSLRAADKAAKLAELKNVLPTFARGDYSIPPTSAQLVVKVVLDTPFDDSDEGKYRAVAREVQVKPEETYDNSFVEKAMRNIK